MIHQLGKQQSALLGVGFLQKCTPEFISLSRVDEHQLAVFDGQSVVDHNVHPFAKLPELQEQNRGGFYSRLV